MPHEGGVELKKGPSKLECRWNAISGMKNGSALRQCATDDDELVPWRSDVKPSLHRAMQRLPGLYVKEVEGPSHGVAPCM